MLQEKNQILEFLKVRLGAVDIPTPRLKELLREEREGRISLEGRAELSKLIAKAGKEKK